MIILIVKLTCFFLGTILLMVSFKGFKLFFRGDFKKIRNNSFSSGMVLDKNGKFRSTLYMSDYDIKERLDR